MIHLRSATLSVWSNCLEPSGGREEGCLSPKRTQIRRGTGPKPRLGLHNEADVAVEVEATSSDNLDDEEW